MYLPRFGPATAMVLSGAALCLLALAPLGWRLGWWHYGFGLYQLLPAAGLVGAVAVAVSIVTLVLGWSHFGPRGLAILSGAVVLGSIIAYVPWQYSRTRNTLPPIHDITTDTRQSSDIQRRRVPDTSLSGARVARELDALIARRGRQKVCVRAPAPHHVQN